MQRVALWLDDNRDPHSNEWREYARSRANGGTVLWVKSCDALDQASVDIFTDPDRNLVAAMFDYDLSTTDTSGENGGYAFGLLKDNVMDFGAPPFELSTQTNSTHGRQLLERGFGTLREYWRDQE